MGWETTTKTKTKTVEKNIGYELIPVCRPKFIFFDFDGLRANTSYWMFFNNVDVTQWCNTSYSYSDFESAGRGAVFRNVGDKYIDETAFPSDLGGPTGTPLTTDSTGRLDGVFYLQSNDDLSFPVGTSTLVAIDVSVLDKGASLSWGTVNYAARGVYDLYATYKETYTTTSRRWVNDDPDPVIEVGHQGGGEGEKGINPPPSTGEDLPGNALSRALGIGRGGQYSRAIASGMTKEQAKEKAGGGNDGIACFLTTAIVERRGEADDGRTLSKLRHFRDTYMRTTEAMEADVTEYYDIAPKILAKIPHNHSDWIFIENIVDQSCAFIDQQKYEEAYFCYKNMVNTLKSNWLN